MAQAALKYETEPQETLLIPEGGIATFLTATEGAWADEKDIPQSGIAQVTHIADRLAEYGRHEDEYMVHAAEGETVIPMAVLEANPRLRKNLFAQMEAMGLDPERYVVGSELNSINPVTGQPEFFLKKLFKGVKKLVKKVVKVVKKALPYVLPIALSFTPLGPVFGAALGSGIGTLMQGGDLGDALKAAVISGGIGGLSAGISGMISGQGFGAGVKGAFGNVGERFGQALGGARPEGAGYWGSPFRPVEAPTFTGPTVDASGLVGPETGVGPGAITSRTPGPGVPRQGIVTVDELGTGPFAQPTQVAGDTVFGMSTEPGIFNTATGRFDPPTTPLSAPTPVTPTIDATTQVADQLPFGDQGLRTFDATSSIYDPADPLTADRGWWGTAKDVFTGGGKPPSHWEKLMKDAGEAYIANTPEKFQTAAGFEAAKAAAGPGMLARYGPTLALAGVGAGAAGFFDPPEPEEDEDEDDPFKDHDPLAYKQYQIAFPTTPTYTMEDIRVPGREVGFAHGGVASLEEARAFPPRSGGITGPGTGRSDDVPAMLSDGEFVMTAEAVKGAGKGSRNNGMKNMYQLMRTFEASV
jgi:hypothetical protein